jgi:hypothetical protein
MAWFWEVSASKPFLYAIMPLYHFILSSLIETSTDDNSYNSKEFTGYVGLENQGVTRYLNAALYSLYFTPCLRKVGHTRLHCLLIYASHWHDYVFTEYAHIGNLSNTDRRSGSKREYGTRFATSILSAWNIWSSSGYVINVYCIYDFLLNQVQQRQMNWRSHSDGNKRIYPCNATYKNSIGYCRTK